MHAWESIQRAVDYIENNINDEITIDKLADEANLSYFYFHRLFSRLITKPVQEYIKLRRLARACESLKNKNNRVLDVALEYGFGSHETFTRAFKEAYGFTPTYYRNNPVQLNNFNKPDLLLAYVMIDEGVPLVSNGIVLEINRTSLETPINFIGVSGHVCVDEHTPGGKVTGVDEPGAIWKRFHEADIKRLPDSIIIGVSYCGDAPLGCFSYFAGTEAVLENGCDKYTTWQFPSQDYIVCTFEAENFELLVTDVIYKAGNYTFTWLEKRGLTCGSFTAEVYPKNASGVAYMEIWYPIIKYRMEESLC